MNQEGILHEVLTRNRQIDELQKEINAYVLMNRKAVELNPSFEEDYSESIESYYINF